MPTGYTHPVQVGKITTLRDFTLNCARAFGALIEMRDEPGDIPTPRSLARSTYHDEALAKAKREYDRLGIISEGQIKVEAQEANISALASWRQRQLEKKRDRLNYEAMIEKVSAWTPPTSEHTELKNFMLKQLRESLDFDCSTRYDEEPKTLTPIEWHGQALERARRDVAYHEKALAEEIERNKNRNRWLADLYDSLPNN